MGGLKPLQPLPLRGPCLGDTDMVLRTQLFKERISVRYGLFSICFHLDRFSVHSYWLVPLFHAIVVTAFPPGNTPPFNIWIWNKFEYVNHKLHIHTNMLISPERRLPELSLQVIILISGQNSIETYTSNSGFRVWNESLNDFDDEGEIWCIGQERFRRFFK